jgi:uridylate kinase
MRLASIYRQGEGADDVIVLKGTKYNGVYDNDPATTPDAKRLSVVSADVMRQNGWHAVDPECLNSIEESGLPLRVYATNGSVDSLKLAAAGEMGTLIVPQPGIMEYAAANVAVQ